MLFTFGENTVQNQSWETKREMLEFLTRSTNGYVLLGENAEQAILFYSIIVCSDTLKKGCYGIGINSEGHGLKPYVLLRPEISIVILGFNSEVVGINVESREIQFRLSLESLFHSFIYLYHQKIILIFHEIGVIAITEKFLEIWRFSVDVITEYFIESDVLHIKFMDSAPVRISISSGLVYE
jgi:hypothetical protein